MINPKVLEWGEKTDVECEGCLSSRSECCVGDVRRAKEILVTPLFHELSSCSGISVCCSS